MGNAKSSSAEGSGNLPPNERKTTTSSRQMTVQEKALSSRKKSSAASIKPIADRKQSLAGGRRSSVAGKTSIASDGGTIKAKPALTSLQRTIVKYCIDNAKEDLGERIFRRMSEKHFEYKFYFDQHTKKEKAELADSLRKTLLTVVNNLNDAEVIQTVSEDFGAKFVQYRSNGFRPDYFALTANCITQECMFLDAAVHSSNENLNAWSAITSYMFSSVRDGYYSELRKNRRMSNTKAKLSVDQTSQENIHYQRQDSQNSRRSVSPGTISSSEDVNSSPSPVDPRQFEGRQLNGENQFLSPNIVY
uniref:GLOBIN domain-containing protein n=1 Tax=Rhabditophanes sp. KR3021 TaxID=114890 RepID=A0AC35TP30_9BILA